ncbi:hypothetical protein ATCVNEJV2_742R [Acanthocystis turfacea Chlorella virus NE-JV-2]|nr:hypothetical protein ATCVNEJV2_742R [Acanthocystis turfacea Chlorella virus NE-JV-2]
MKTLQYYSDKGELMVFDDYTIDKKGVIRNKKGHVMAQIRTKSGYYNIVIPHEGTRRNIGVARALASTFIGPPQTLKHSVDHRDRTRGNNISENIIWEDKSGQRKNQDRPGEHKTAFTIERNGVELAAKEWVKVFKKPDGTKYTERTILRFAREKNMVSGTRYFRIFEEKCGKPCRIPRTSMASGSSRTRIA